MEIINNGSVTSPKGFLAAGVNAGFKKDKLDFMLLFSKSSAVVAGCFTQNQVVAAPVTYCKRLMELRESGRVVAINSGVANACTGEAGLEWCDFTAVLVSQYLNVKVDDVYLASTGVIGRALDLEKMRIGIEKASLALNDEGGIAASQAIMTTDTVPKSIAVSCETPKGKFVIGGMAKGSGMIAPNMATMLSVVTTDAKIEQGLLQKILKSAVDRSFNLVTVDGDTSTNDTLLALANGESGIEILEDSSEEKLFISALDCVCQNLAKMIARDGEGATKMIEITVRRADIEDNARKIAMTIANSPLVKTAVFGNDPNWGRVFVAAGRAGVVFDQMKCGLVFAGVEVVRLGEPLPFDKAGLSNKMKADEVKIELDMAMGEKSAVAWTCDFSYEYVKINGEYTT